MNQSLTGKEYLKFFKQSKKVIISVFLSFILIFGIAFIVLNYILPSEETEVEEIEQITVIDEETAQEYLLMDYSELTSRQQSDLIEYLDRDAYIFTFYVENEQGEPFTNFRTIKEIIISEDTVNSIEASTNVTMLPDPQRAIRMDFNGNTNIHKFLVGIGDRVDNLELANAYYELFLQEELEFFDNKNVIMLNDEPYLNFSQEEDIDPSDIEEPTGQETTIVFAIVLILAAFVFSIIASLLTKLFSKRITYLFNYQLTGNEKLYKLHQLTENNPSLGLEYLTNLLKPYKGKTLILSDGDVPEAYVGFLKKLTSKDNISQSQTILTSETEDGYENIVILTSVNKTSKSWYKTQLHFARNYASDLTVIEVDHN